MHFGLTEEQEMFVSTVRSFVENEIYPHEAIVERTGEVPAEIAQEIKQNKRRENLIEFADQARRWSAWPKAYYEQLRGQGKRHHAAVRALAFKWIRIIFRMWKTRTPYDENRYQQQLQRRNSPLAKYLPR